MIGQIQSLALAAVVIVLIGAAVLTVERTLDRRHKRRMKRMEQGHEIATEVNDEYDE